VFRKAEKMKLRINKTFFGVAAATSLLAVGSAQADHVSVGLGLSDGYGNFLSVGVNNGGHHGCGPSYAGRVYVAPPPVVVAPAPVVYAQPAPVVVAQPAPVVYAQPAPAPVVYAQPAPVVYTQPSTVVVQSGGYWQEVDNRVWCEGVWIDFVDEWGHHGRRRGPGHWENHHSREWRGGGFGGGFHGGPGGGPGHR